MALLAGRWNVVRILLFGIVCLMPIAVSGEKRAMTVDDMLDMVRIGDVVMTPDCSRVFNTERRLNWEKNTYEKTLLIFPSEGGEAVPFVTTDEGENFRVSPDGATITFDSDLEGGLAIFAVDADGKNLRRLGTRGSASFANWAPDGRMILFTGSIDKANRAILHTMEPDGSNWQAVTGSAADEIAPGWNPADFTK